METYFQRTFFLTALLLTLGYGQNLGLQTNDVGDNFLSTKINWLFDRFLTAYRHELIIHGETVMPIGNFEEHFSTKVFVFNVDGYLSVENGSIKDLSTLERTGDVFLERDGDDLILTANLGMTDFKVNYQRYKLSLMGITQSGGINATVGDDSVCIKIRLTLKPKCKVKLQSLKIETLENIDISISGLGPMNGLADDISSWVVTHITHSYRSNLQSLIFDDMEEAIIKADLCSHFHF